MDEIAERARQLGGRAFGTLAEFAKTEDVGTSDFLTGLLEKYEKMAWMLRAFLA